MESVQIIEAILHYMAEIALIGFSLYIFASHNKKAGAFLAVYSIFSLISFLMFQGVFGREILEKVFYAGGVVNLYLQIFGILGSLAKFSLLLGVYFLVVQFATTENKGNDS